MDTPSSTEVIMDVLGCTVPTTTLCIRGHPCHVPAIRRGPTVPSVDLLHWKEGDRHYPYLLTRVPLRSLSEDPNGRPDYVLLGHFLWFLLTSLGVSSSVGALLSRRSSLTGSLPLVLVPKTFLETLPVSTGHISS